MAAIGIGRMSKIARIKNEATKCVNNFSSVDTFAVFNIPSTFIAVRWKERKLVTILYWQFFSKKKGSLGCVELRKADTYWKCKEVSAKIYCTKIKFAPHRHWIAANSTREHALSTTAYAVSTQSRRKVNFQLSASTIEARAQHSPTLFGLEVFLFLLKFGGKRRFESVEPMLSHNLLL